MSLEALARVVRVVQPKSSQYLIRIIISQSVMYKSPRLLFRDSKHFICAVHKLTDHTPIPRAFYCMLPHHINHFKVAFNHRDVVLEYLECTS